MSSTMRLPDRSAAARVHVPPGDPVALPAAPARDAMARLALPLAAAALMAVPCLATAAEVQLPRQMAWASYDVGSSGHIQAVAIAAALTNAYGVTLRIVPAGTDVSRLAPVRDGRIDFATSGSDVFYAAEGVLTFGTPEWGPQPIRLATSSSADNCLAMGTAADAGIHTPEDLRGKRVGWVVGAPSLQTNVTAFMAFGGVTWDDVDRVEVGSFGAAWTAMINGQIDAMSAFTTGATSEQLAASSRGLRWLDLPHDDEEGWARLTAVAPHFVPHVGTMGANMNPDNPLNCASFPYPVLIHYAGQDDDLVYNIVRAVSEQVETFAAAEPTAGGWADDRQVFRWVVPFADGAIRYWREIGVWTDEDQAHNDQLLARQAVLAEAWEAYTAAPAEDFTAGWMQARAAALTEAGFEPHWTE